ncbi:MAG: hypothetical protein E6I28_07590 [Chloroflexi bacterium]|nr:MAG: hypothetical protein E6I28_07590 [Chloroflexota bacterium]
MKRDPDVVLTGRFDETQLRRYFHLPFTVPTGTRQVHVRYSYDHQIDSDPLLVGGNTLDIGMFDERGIAASSPGYRGWSGSEKLAFTIDAEWATPPYRAGAIGAGTWHVMLGPYKVAPQGLEYRVEIFFNADLPRAERVVVRRGPPTRPSLQPPAESGWARGDLHCHTLYSDGDSWPGEMLVAAAESGLAFLGVTDHNNVAHHGEYGRGGGELPIVVPGVEVTTYRGHWNAWGTDRWYEFREPTDESVSAAMRDAAAAGALVSTCHPKPFGPPWEYASARGYHAIEVWNGPWERLNAARGTASRRRVPLGVARRPGALSLARRGRRARPRRRGPGRARRDRRRRTDDRGPRRRRRRLGASHRRSMHALPARSGRRYIGRDARALERGLERRRLRPPQRRPSSPSISRMRTYPATDSR